MLTKLFMLLGYEPLADGLNRARKHDTENVEKLVRAYVEHQTKVYKVVFRNDQQLKITAPRLE
jgi:hypothetical protein